MSKKLIREEIRECFVTLGKQNEKMVVVNADLARSCRCDSFVHEFPERSFNVGIAEQDMVSFAAGLACEGFIPFVFTMAPFLTMRSCEQIRTDIAYGNRNVKLVASSGGVSGGIQGATHWSIEDCAIMRSIPNMTVMEPSDANQFKSMMSFCLAHKGPVYVRYCYVPLDHIYDEQNAVKSGGSNVVFEGNDGVILCSGVIVHFALEAAKEIEKETGKRIRVVDMYCIKPIDENAVIEATKTGAVLVAQDHNIYGALGSAVAELIAQKGISVPFKICGINDRFVAMARPEYLYHLFGIDAEGLKKEMMNLLKNRDK